MDDRLAIVTDSHYIDGDCCGFTACPNRHRLRRVQGAHRRLLVLLESDGNPSGCYDGRHHQPAQGFSFQFVLDVYGQAGLEVHSQKPSLPGWRVVQSIATDSATENDHVSRPDIQCWSVNEGQPERTADCTWISVRYRRRSRYWRRFRWRDRRRVSTSRTHRVCTWKATYTACTS